MQQRFGTDGIRGVANRSLTPEFALRLGRAVAQALGDVESDEPVLVGRDTRCSGPLLEGAFVAGLLSTGRDVRSLGVAPTPAVAMIARRTHARAGVVISASHNPIEDNGFKIFDRDGMKLPDAMERAIEFALDRDDEAPRPTHAAVGRLEARPELLETYLEAILAQSARLDGVHVVVDAAFGAAWAVAPDLFARLGATVEALHAEPDGGRINVHCGATDTRALEAAVRAAGARGRHAVGVAFDGDADRVRFVDEAGEAVDGDLVMLTLARDLHRRGELAAQRVVGTVMSNLACERALAEDGIALVRTPVGDRHVLERLRADGAIFGGEPSGHLIDLRRNVTGDGPAMAVALLNVLAERGLRLHDLARAYAPYPQELINIRVRSHAGVLEHPALLAAQAEAVARLGEAGRLLIRPSGTEPLVRVMVEGEDAPLVRELAASLAQIVRELAAA